VLGSPARAIIRFRFLIIAFWVVVAAFAIPRASHVHDVLEVEGATQFPTESKAARAILRDQFPEPLNAFFVVAIEGPTPIDSPAYRDALRRIENAARAQPYISLVLSPLSSDNPALVSEDRRAGLPDSVVVLTSDGRLLVRSAAAIHVLRRLGGLWSWAAAAAAVVPRGLRDWLYNRIAAVRFRLFGRKHDACPVLSPELRRRFELD